MKPETEKILSPDQAAKLECKLADIRRDVGWDAEYLERHLSELARSLRLAAVDENLTGKELRDALSEAEEELSDLLWWANRIKEQIQ